MQLIEKSRIGPWWCIILLIKIVMKGGLPPHTESSNNDGMTIISGML